MGLTQHKNIADATDPQDATPLHQVQSIAGITALTGDVTATGPGSAAATIATGAVTNTKRANMAASTLSGNATGAPAAPTDLTAAAVKTLLAISFSDIAGTLLAAQFPALTGDVTTTAGSLATTLANLPQSVLIARTGALTAALPMNAQKITGVADPSNPQDAATKHYVDASFSGGVPLTDGDKGDVVVSGSGAVWTVDNDVVTFPKMQNIPTQTLVGRQTAGTGDPESIGVTGGIEFDGAGNIRRSALTGDVSASAGSAGTAINPNVVTNAQLAQVPTATLKGRSAAGTGNVSDLTAAAVKTLLAISFADVTGTVAAAQFPALTGDVTTPGGSLATTLAATGVTAATYGDASHVAQVTVDAKGRVTAASSPSISITAGAVSGLSTTQTGALTGDVTKPAGSGTTTLANIPAHVPVAGDLLLATAAVPATPSAGHLEVWASNTDEVLAAKGVGGSITHTVKTCNAIAHQFLVEVTDSGDVSSARPSAADITGLEPIASTQIPANSIVGNNTGVAASALALTAADVRTFLDIWDGPFQYGFAEAFVSGQAPVNVVWMSQNETFLRPASPTTGFAARAAYTECFLSFNVAGTAGLSSGGRKFDVSVTAFNGTTTTVLLTISNISGAGVFTLSATGLSGAAGHIIGVRLSGTAQAGDVINAWGAVWIR